jgi:hypothetical protein
MPITNHHRPELRSSIEKLLGVLVPAVEGGGDVPLTSIVEAVVGDKLTAEVRAKLDSRGAVAFTVTDGVTSFRNDGPATKVPLKHFSIKIAPRLVGWARRVEDGAILRFDGAHTLFAAKLFFQVKLETIEVTKKRIFIDLEGDSFDQLITL